MSTVAPPRPPAPPIHPSLVDSEQFIDDHIRRTQRGLKLVDLAAGLLTLAVGLVAFLLAAAVIDHWIVPGGLGAWGRGTMFGLLVLGLAWFAWRQFVPLVRSINPVYAAHTIEQTAPSLKNSLLNVLLFRSHRQGMSAKVFHALEQQAAYRLSSAHAEAVIDRTGLLRLGYALVAVVAAAALYAVLSPKDLAASMGRVVAPWANIAAPSRVQVLEVQPGDASVARGERVPISAAIIGADEDDAVRIRYSTFDEALVGESIAMTRPTGAARFSAELPRGGDAAGADGVQKDLEYWIEAGDGRSPKYKLTVYTRPTIVVQRVRYKYPAYTGDPPKVVENVGDLFGLEGTEVTVEAVANHPIQMAYVDFDADGTTDVKMNVDGKQATATFALALRDDRRTPWHLGYVLRYTTSTGLANEDPVQHRIDVTPDYAPEVSIARPEEAELAVRVSDVVPIVVEARDPDFALQNVGLRGEVRGGEALHVDLLNNRHAGLFRQEHRLTPADLQLKAGDVLEYWAVARDNREPPGEEVASERRRLRIVDPNDPRVPRNPGGQGGDDQIQGGDENEGGEQGGDGGAEGGQAGGGASGEAGENEAGEGGAGGGAGEGEPQQGENQEGGGAEGGGESSEQQPSGNGEGGANSGGGESEGGAQDGSQENSTNQGGEQNPGDSGGDAGDEASGGGSTGSGGGDQGGRQESVSSEGEEDAEAFDRIRRRMAEQQAGQGGDSAGGDAEEGGEAAESGSEAGAEGAEETEGNDSESPSEGADAASGESADAESSTGESAGAQSQGEHDEGDPSEGEAGEGSSEGGQGDSSTSRPGDRNTQEGESTGANAESDSENENGESPESANETPAGADGGANPSNGESSAGDDASGEGGAPEASHKGPRDQAEDDEPSQTGIEGETPTADTRGRTESDASGDQSGDRAGDGQKGGGQQAENAGEGEAGSHSPTDTGANQSSDPGAGATGTEAGDEQLADGETGESSGDQAGDGSESGESAGETSQNPGGDQTGAGSESEAGASESAGEPGGEGSEGGANDGGAEAGEAGTSGQQPGSPSGSESSAGDSEPTGEDSSEQGDSAQGDSSGGSAAPPTGGGTSGGGVDGPGATSEPGGDDANLAYAREQTDLVLESLEEQLAKEQVDEELLDDLGWNAADLRNFVDRWKGLFDAAERDGAASDSQERLDAALRSLGPGARGNLQLQGSAPADELRDLNDSYRARAPLEYADRVRAYLRGASAADESDN